MSELLFDGLRDLADTRQLLLAQGFRGAISDSDNGNLLVALAK